MASPSQLRWAICIGCGKLMPIEDGYMGRGRHYVCEVCEVSLYREAETVGEPLDVDLATPSRA